MAQKEFTQHYPKAGWVEHDPLEIYASQYGVLVEGAGPQRHGGGRDLGHRHHQPARDDHRLGQKHRPSGVQCHRVAVPPHVRFLHESCGAGAMRTRSGPKTGLLIDAYFSATKSSGSWTMWRAHVSGPSGANFFIRHRGHLAHLEADGRRGPCDGRHQRLAHDAVQHPYAGMGQGYLCAARHSHVHAAQSLRFQHGVRCGAHRRGRNTHRGRGGRPAGRPVRPDMLCAGRCEKYIRHGLLYADEHRGHTCGEQKRPAHHRGRRPEREGDLCAGGQCVRGRAVINGGTS